MPLPHPNLPSPSPFPELLPSPHELHKQMQKIQHPPNSNIDLIQAFRTKSPLFRREADDNTIAALLEGDERQARITDSDYGDEVLRIFFLNTAPTSDPLYSTRCLNLLRDKAGLSGLVLTQLYEGNGQWAGRFANGRFVYEKKPSAGGGTAMRGGTCFDLIYHLTSPTLSHTLLHLHSTGTHSTYFIINPPSTLYSRIQDTVSRDPAVVTRLFFPDIVLVDDVLRGFTESACELWEDIERAEGGSSDGSVKSFEEEESEDDEDDDPALNLLFIIHTLSNMDTHLSFLSEAYTHFLATFPSPPATPHPISGHMRYDRDLALAYPTFFTAGKNGDDVQEALPVPDGEEHSITPEEALSNFPPRRIPHHLSPSSRPTSPHSGLLASIKPGTTFDADPTIEPDITSSSPPATIEVPEPQQPHTQTEAPASNVISLDTNSEIEILDIDSFSDSDILSLPCTTPPLSPACGPQESTATLRAGVSLTSPSSSSASCFTSTPGSTTRGASASSSSAPISTSPEGSIPTRSPCVTPAFHDANGLPLLSYLRTKAQNQRTWLQTSQSSLFLASAQSEAAHRARADRHLTLQAQEWEAEKECREEERRCREEERQCREEARKSKEEEKIHRERQARVWAEEKEFRERVMLEEAEHRDMMRERRDEEQRLRHTEEKERAEMWEKYKERVRVGKMKGIELEEERLLAERERAGHTSVKPLMESDKVQEREGDREQTTKPQPEDKEAEKEQSRRAFMETLAEGERQFNQLCESTGGANLWGEIGAKVHRERKARPSAAAAGVDYDKYKETILGPDLRTMVPTTTATTTKAPSLHPTNLIPGEPSVQDPNNTTAEVVAVPDLLSLSSLSSLKTRRQSMHSALISSLASAPPPSDVGFGAPDLLEADDGEELEESEVSVAEGVVELALPEVEASPQVYEAVEHQAAVVPEAAQQADVNITNTIESLFQLLISKRKEIEQQRRERREREECRQKEEDREMEVEVESVRWRVALMMEGRVVGAVAPVVAVAPATPSGDGCPDSVCGTGAAAGSCIADAADAGVSVGGDTTDRPKRIKKKIKKRSRRDNVQVEAEPRPNPVPKPAPELDPEPVSVPELDPVSEPEPAPEPEPEPTLEESETETRLVDEQVAELEPIPDEIEEQWPHEEAVEENLGEPNWSSAREAADAEREVARAWQEAEVAELEAAKSPMRGRRGRVGGGGRTSVAARGETTESGAKGSRKGGKDGEHSTTTRKGSGSGSGSRGTDTSRAFCNF